MSKGGYLLIIPLLLLLAIVEFYPLAMTFYLSIIDYGSSGSITSTNYIKLFSDPAFLNSVLVSIAYATGSTVIFILIGLLLALILTLRFRGKSFFEAAFIIPLAVSPIIAGVVWSPSAVWDDVNTFIHFVLGLPYIDLTQTYVFFPIMILSDAWEWSPLMMLVAINIINSQRREIYEAASVYGSSSLQTFRYISLPAILKSPVTQFIIVIRFIDSLRSFEIPFAWSNWVGYQQLGSPVDTLSLFLFKLLVLPAYGLPISYIAALSFMLLAITFIGTFVLLRFMRVIQGL